MEVVYTLSKNRPLRWANERPTKVDGQIASRTTYYRKELFRIIKGCFELKCPLEWNRDYLLDLLIRDGYFVITKTSAGVIPIRSSLTGFNYTNFPISVIAALPVLGDFTRELGIDAEVVYLEWSRERVFFNFNEMVDIFAQRLASCDCGIDVNVMNAKMAYVAEAESRGQAEAIKKMFDDISDGEPLVVYPDSGLSQRGLNLFFNNLKQNYIALELQETKLQIMYEFLTKLGINNANTTKRERMLVDEVNANNEEILVCIGEFEETLKICNQKVKKMFPDLDFELKLRFDSRTREEEERKNDIRRDDSDMGNSTSNN